jgi:hypothetical protein
VTWENAASRGRIRRSRGMGGGPFAPKLAPSYSALAYATGATSATKHPAQGPSSASARLALLAHVTSPVTSSPRYVHAHVAFITTTPVFVGFAI